MRLKALPKNKRILAAATVGAAAVLLALLLYFLPGRKVPAGLPLAQTSVVPPSSAGEEPASQPPASSAAPHSSPASSKASKAPASSADVAYRQVTAADLQVSDCFLGETDKLASLCGLFSRFPYDIALYYEDLETGASIGYQAEKNFHPASVIKAPYMMYVLESISGGKGSLSDVFTYREENFREGSGVIKDKAFGAQFTTNQLIEYSIRHSDNIAFYLLRGKYGEAGFASYARRVGVASAGNPLNRFSAKDGAVYFKEIYSKERQGDENAKLLMKYLKSTAYNQQLPAGLGGKTMAHKYGWWNGYYHDAGVVYDEHPYYLAVLTTYDPEGSPVKSVFKQAARLVDALHADVQHS